MRDFVLGGFRSLWRIKEVLEDFKEDYEVLGGFRGSERSPRKVSFNRFQEVSIAFRRIIDVSGDTSLSVQATRPLNLR